MAIARDLSGNSPIGGGVDRRIRDKGIFVLAASAVAVVKTGDTNESLLASVNIPAGAMGPNGILRIAADWGCTNSANNKTPRIRLGGLAGTLVCGLAFTTVPNVFYSLEVRNRNSESAQYNSIDRSRATDLVSTYEVLTTAVDTTVAQVLAFTAQLASAGETITLESYLVELIVP